MHNWGRDPAGRKWVWEDERNEGPLKKVRRAKEMEGDRGTELCNLLGETTETV